MIKSVLYGPRRLKTDVNDVLSSVVKNVTPKQRELVDKLYGRKDLPEFPSYLERRADVHATEFGVYFSKSQKKADRADFLMSIINAIHDDGIEIEAINQEKGIETIVIEPEIVEPKVEPMSNEEIAELLALIEAEKPIVIDVEAIERYEEPIMLALPAGRIENRIDVLSYQRYMQRIYMSSLKQEQPPQFVMQESLQTTEAIIISEIESCEEIRERILARQKKKVNKKYERIDASLRRLNEYFDTVNFADYFKAWR